MIQKQGKSSSLEQRVNNYEEEMKQKFIEKMQRPGVSYADCLDCIENELEQSKKMAKINYRIQCFRNDGIYQLNKAISEVFGSVTSKESTSPSGDSNVETIDITLADGTRVKVPYGGIELDGLGEDSRIDINYDEDEHELIVTGIVQFRFYSLMDDIIEQTRVNLKNSSIYKGQALEISNICEPGILDLSSIDNQLMVLSKETEYALRPINARILNPEKCIEKGIPLKFGALLEGGYGTGKTLLAFKLAREAVKNDWIFIYLKDPKLLAESLRMSKIIDQSGHGIIIFVEDIDQVTRGDRDEAMQDILNTLDGGDTKDMNVITLFTTNHIELIEPTFLRGKRIGTVISMGNLDAETAEEFIRKSFDIGCYQIEDDLTEVCKFIEESQIAPAFMAEIIEKVKSVMILTDECIVKAEYIMNSVKSYLHQVKLSQKKDMSLTPEKKLVEAIKECFNMSNRDKLMSQFIAMVEDHCGESVTNYG